MAVRDIEGRRCSLLISRVVRGRGGGNEQSGVSSLFDVSIAHKTLVIPSHISR